MEMLNFIENIQKQKLIAEIEKFKTESLKTHVVKVWADSYENSDPFSYVINEENNQVWWMKTQAHQLWEMWQAAKLEVGSELQSYIAVWSFRATNDGEDYIVVDANILAKKIEELTGANS